MAENLTEKQRRFVEAYMSLGGEAGSIRPAAEKAGLDYDYARRLVTKRHIQDAMRERQEGDPAVATREERQRFWTSVLRGEVAGASMRDRLKASELLGKTGGDFGADGSKANPHHIVTRVIVEEVTGPGTGGG